MKIICFFISKTSTMKTNKRKDLLKIVIYCFYSRWSQGLLFHQGAVDCARAALLLPLGVSILHCQPVQKCSLVETAFLLLVTVATVNMLTTVLNDSPVS